MAEIYIPDSWANESNYFDNYWDNEAKCFISIGEIQEWYFTDESSPWVDLSFQEFFTGLLCTKRISAVDKVLEEWKEKLEVEAANLARISKKVFEGESISLVADDLIWWYQKNKDFLGDLLYAGVFEK